MSDKWFLPPYRPYKEIDPVFKAFCLISLVCVIAIVFILFTVLGRAQEKPDIKPAEPPKVMKVEGQEFLEFKLLVSERDNLDNTLRGISVQIQNLSYQQRDVEKELAEAKKSTTTRWSEICKRLGVDPDRYAMNKKTGELVPVLPSPQP